MSGTGGPPKNAIAFLDGLAPSARATLMARGHHLEVSAGREIFGGREATTLGGVLLQGRARVFLMGPDGRQLTLRYAKPGSLVGFVAGRMEGAQVWADTDCSVLAFSQHDLDALLATDQSVARAFIGELSQRLVAIVALLSSRAFAPVERRLAAWLTDLDATAPRRSDRPHVLRVTQQALADDLGTSREVVHRLLHRFARDGLVDLQAGAITIRDPIRLRSLSHPQER